MIELKRINADAIPAALEKAERYRLLNEPEEAESICLDVIAVEPDNQSALIMLLLALSDQLRLGHAECFHEAQSLLPRLRGDYERRYYSGILWERRASARLDHGGPGTPGVAYTWMRKAMDCYEEAEKLRPANNDDALLRWNTCARLSMRHDLRPEAEMHYEPALEE